MERQRNGNMPRQGFLQGAVILTAATMLVKVIGMFFKIPLSNLLGAAGMSYFQTAYSIFSPVYALSIAGFPAAISKLVSESAARGHYRNVRRIKQVSLWLLTALGIISFAGLFVFSRWITRVVGNPQAFYAVAAMAPSILFCCLMAAWRGYYQGLGDMMPTAASQVVEALAKLLCGIGLAWYVLDRGMGEYARTGAVFGVPAQTQGQAELLALPYAAAGAILGVTISTALGCFYLMIRQWARGDGIGRQTVRDSAPGRPAGEISRQLLAIAFPVCLASLISHMTNLVDVMTIMHRVGSAMERGPEVILQMYGGLLPADLPTGDIPSYLYGAYGFAANIFNLVPSLTVAFGISALPMVASHWSLGNRAKAAVQIHSVIKLSALLAIPAGLGIAALAQPILELLYPARMQEVAIAAPILRSLGLAAVFVGIVTPINSIFQAIGKAVIPVKLMLVGAVIKIAANYVLIAIPTLNVLAVPYGTIFCYAFILLASLFKLQKELHTPLPLGAVLLKPLLCGIICAIAANTAYGLLANIFQSRVICLLSIGIGGSIYLIFVLFLRIITKNEALMLPRGKKVAKILEKLALLG